jgi:hypothetical protein
MAMRTFRATVTALIDQPLSFLGSQRAART